MSGNLYKTDATSQRSALPLHIDKMDHSKLSNLLKGSSSTRGTHKTRVGVRYEWDNMSNDTVTASSIN